jgi:predicted metal-dependent peptidase
MDDTSEKVLQEYSLEDDIIRLLRKEPFYGRVIISMRRKEEPSLGTTMAVGIRGGLTLYYNPTFLRKLPPIEREADLKHEALHVVNRHFVRCGDLEAGKTLLRGIPQKVSAAISKMSKQCLRRFYNYGSDTAINQYIEGISKDSLFPWTFRLPSDLSAEEYVALLIEKTLDQQTPQSGGQGAGKGDRTAQETKGEQGDKSENPSGQGQCSGSGASQPEGQSGETGEGPSGTCDENSCGNCSQCPLSGKGCGNSQGICGARLVDDHSQWQGSQADREHAATQAVIIVRDCHKRGLIPGDMQSSLSDILYPQVNWKAVLTAFPASCTSTETSRSWMRLSRRMPYSIKGKKRHQRLALVVVIDTSGSISDQTLAEFWAEVTAIAEHCDELTVLECDAEVQDVYPFKKTLTVEFKGRGGTSFTPAFEYIAARENRLRPDGVIFFTDGYGDDPPPFRKAPVLWVVTPNGKTPAAWGRSIHIPG